MHLVMFHIDGTLDESCDCVSQCFAFEVREVLDVPVDKDWQRFTHIIDQGIIRQLITESGHSEADEALINSSYHDTHKVLDIMDALMDCYPKKFPIFY